MLAGVTQHDGGTERGLHHQVGGDGARGNPSRMPASIIASTRKKKYAGPLPDKAVTASCCDSGTRSTLPTGASSASVAARCSGPAWDRRGDRGHRLVDEHGRVGHHPDHRRAGREPALQEGGRDARGHADHELTCRRTATISSSIRTHVLRLHRQQQRAGLLGGLLRADDRYPVSRAQLLRPCLAAHHGGHVGRRPARSSPESSASPILPALSIAITLSTSSRGRP